MKFKKIIAMGAAIAIFTSSAFSVSAAEKLSGDDINALKESGKVELIIDVDAYKAAYSDLAQAFGDNVDAYIEHYLTIGVYEGRNKGVLFDPLAYAETYGDIKNAYGTDILAIVNHYVEFGVKENRTAGTANGYADLATAERNGASNGNVTKPRAYSNSTSGTTPASSYSDTLTGGGSTVANSSNAGSSVVNAPVNNASAGSTPASSNNTTTSPSYHHTTSIYADDEKTLIRVEYYDDNNKLIQYSDVTDYNSDTNSYKETVYNAADNELDRTDTYDNGSLSSSEKAE